MGAYGIYQTISQSFSSETEMASRTSEWVDTDGGAQGLCEVGGRGVFGGWIDPAGPDGSPAGDCAKRTQFGEGGDLSRSHRGIRDRCKCSGNNELDVILRGLCVSVVNDETPEMPGRSLGPDYAKRTQCAVGSSLDKRIVRNEPNLGAARAWLRLAAAGEAA
jgi:hypothetical protein